MAEHPPTSLPRDPVLWLVVATFIVVNLPYVIPVFSGSLFDVYVEYFTIPPLLVAGIFACLQRPPLRFRNVRFGSLPAAEYTGW